MKNRSNLLARAMVLLVLISSMMIACDSLVIDKISPIVSIVGGKPTNYEEWQGAIAVYVNDEDYSDLLLCTGTLIHPQIVLTAGHCMMMDDGSLFYDLRDTPDSIEIRGGATKSDMQTLATAADIKLHPKWEGDINKAWAVDLAMIFLDKPIDNIDYYPVRYGTSPVGGETGVIVGYGISDQADYPALTTAEVHRAGDVTIILANEHAMIAGGGSSICIGDSGGPLFTMQDDEWAVAGVHSSVEVTIFGTLLCDPSRGGTHQSTVTYRNWIEETYFSWLGEKLANTPDLIVDASVLDSGAEADSGVVDGDGEDEQDQKNVKATADCSCSTISHSVAPSILAVIYSILTF